MVSLSSFAQDLQVDEEPVKMEKKWFQSISLRGYTQTRYNGLFNTNPDLKCEQCDRSWGGNREFFVRRARLVISGQLHERVAVYIQPDFASAISATSLNFLQIRDLYADISLDRKGEFRLRPGISKVPYGFENMQSSQNRLPLDRNDGLNSAVSNERDHGIFFYYAPQKIRQRFRMLQNGIMKGSGDYGMIALGMYNGQTLNRPEQNDNFHTVARITYPFEMTNGQIIELGLQGYTGKYVVTSFTRGLIGGEDIISKEGAITGKEFLDRRAAGSIIVYPQPFGFQAEYNVGEGPQFDPTIGPNGSIEKRPLSGGYIMSMYRIQKGEMYMFPFARYYWYDGGKKHELDARKYRVRELELGVEWQPFPNLEVVAMYVFSDRTFEDAVNPTNRQIGRLLRLQVQINY